MLRLVGHPREPCACRHGWTKDGQVCECVEFFPGGTKCICDDRWPNDGKYHAAEPGCPMHGVGQRRTIHVEDVPVIHAAPLDRP